MSNRQEVIKHSAAIHIQNSISLLQRQTWNVLLANAYDELEDEEEHQIRVKDLMNTLEFDSKNEKYLKESLVALANCQVQWDLLDKDGDPDWGVMNLLAQARINKGICTYAYAPAMRKQLHNPRMYARISLRLQNRFSSKHAQALWELCVDYLDETRGYGETPWISLADYRKLMAIGRDEYPRFARFNERVVKEPIAEINKVTDFHVDCEQNRERRKVVSIKFKVARVRQLPGQSIRQGTLFADYDDAPLVWELKQLGFSTNDAWDIWQKRFEKVDPDNCPKDVPFDDYLREKIDLVRRYKAAGGIKRSVTGFLRKAIEENWTNPEFIETQTKETEAKEKRAKDAKRQGLEEKRVELEKSRRTAAREVCERLISESPEMLSAAVQTLQESDEEFQKAYDPSKTPADNYQNTAFIKHWIDPEIEKLHPEHFEGVQKAYDEQLRKIEGQLAH